MANTKTTYDAQMIKRAMKKVGYTDGINEVLDVLDEMELDKRLAISIAQADRGEFVSEKELQLRIDKAFV